MNSLVKKLNTVILKTIIIVWLLYQIYKYECVSSYRINKPKNPKKLVRISNKQHEENLESDEGLALLIPDIQDTANLVQVRFMQLLKLNIN